MAENNTESFALGLIVAAVLFLLFRREIAAHQAGRAVAAQPNVPAAAVSSGCGACGSSAASQIANSSSPVSLGGQSYSRSAYPGSSVAPLQPFETSPGHVQWLSVN